MSVRGGVVYGGLAAVGVLSVVAIGLSTFALKGVQRSTVAAAGFSGGPTIPKGGGPGDSPIRVRGGSMTIHAKKGWTSKQVDTAPYTSRLIDGSVITLYGVKVNGKVSNQPMGWINIVDSWKISVYARDKPGTGDAPDGVQICSNSTCDIKTSLSGPVSVTLEPLNNGNFYPNGGVDDSTSGSNLTTRFSKRFKNPNTCNVGEFCEHIGKIVVQIGQKSYEYRCVNGECEIGIGR